MTEINFLNTEDIASKKKGGKGKYVQYKKVVVGIVDDIVNSIEDNDKGIAVVGVDDMKKAIDMQAKSEPAVHRGLKFAFWEHDIVIDIGENKSGDRVFVFRDKTDDDKLPESLEKLMNE